MRNKKFILTAIVALGLCFSVGAATGVKISAELKKQVINVAGKESTNEVIVYNATTYVPLRQAGNMLGTTVEYKDGIIYLGKEEKTEEKTQVELTTTDWVVVEDGDTVIFQNEKLGAQYAVLESEYFEQTPEEFLKYLTTEVEGVEHAESTNIGDYNVIYIETVVDGTKQIEAYVYYEAEEVEGVKLYPVDTIVMSKLDNSDPTVLKDELLSVVESYLAE